ncbi:MAG: hypothetical protein WD017_08395, partial [Cucumibacter sp.]
MRETTQTMPPGPDDKVDWLAVFSFWLFISLVFILRTRLFADTVPLLGDTDDALRLVQVRDLLAGQSWFDTTQYRLNPPDGASVHWSRLVDAPIAGIILALRPFLGAFADTAAAYVWPLILLAALLATSAHLCIRLLGREALLPAVVLPVISATLMFQFGPGRIDHHNVQILLTLLIVSGTLGSWRAPNWAILAGLAAAVSLAIGTETLPFVVMAIATFGLLWVFSPHRGTAARRFGLSLGLGTVLVMAATIAPDRWFEPACDALSLVYAIAALASGAVLAIVPFFSIALRSALARFLVIGILGLAAIGLVIALFPQCLGGPYAELDPWLAENWLSRIIEAKPIWTSVADMPAYTIGIIVPPLIALVAVTARLWREPKDRPQWLILWAFLAFSILVMIVQIRGARLAAILAVPGASWVIVSARHRYLAARNVLNMTGLVLAWLIFSGLALAVAMSAFFPDEANRLNNADVA